MLKLLFETFLVLVWSIPLVAQTPVYSGGSHEFNDHDILASCNSAVNSSFSTISISISNSNHFTLQNSYCSVATQSPFAGGSIQGWDYHKTGSTACNPASAFATMSITSARQGNFLKSNDSCHVTTNSPYTGGWNTNWDYYDTISTSCNVLSSHSLMSSTSAHQFNFLKSNDSCHVTTNSPYTGGWNTNWDYYDTTTTLCKTLSSHSIMSVTSANKWNNLKSNDSCQVTTNSPYTGGWVNNWDYYDTIRTTGNVISAHSLMATSINPNLFVGNFNGCNYALPIRLLSFTASPLEEKVRLDWITSSELNNEYFDVEKSYDLNTWIWLEKVKGNGTTQTQHTYQTHDEYPRDGVQYYRIKQVDFDGEYEYSDIRSVQYNRAQKIVSYPNPTNGKITILSSHPLQEVKLTITNNEGKIVDVLFFDELNLQEIDLTDYASGIYFVQLSSTTKQEVIRLVKIQ